MTMALQVMFNTCLIPLLCRAQKGTGSPHDKVHHRGAHTPFSSLYTAACKGLWNTGPEISTFDRTKRGVRSNIS